MNPLSDKLPQTIVFIYVVCTLKYAWFEKKKKLIAVYFTAGNKALHFMVESM